MFDLFRMYSIYNSHTIIVMLILYIFLAIIPSPLTMILGHPVYKHTTKSVILSRTRYVHTSNIRYPNLIVYSLLQSMEQRLHRHHTYRFTKNAQGHPQKTVNIVSFVPGPRHCPVGFFSAHSPEESCPRSPPV